MTAKQFDKRVSKLINEIFDLRNTLNTERIGDNVPNLTFDLLKIAQISLENTNLDDKGAN